MKLLFTISLSTVLFANTAQAATFVQNRQSLMANDSVNWSVLGPTFTPVSNPIKVNSSQGLGLQATVPTGSFIRIDQNPFFPGAFDIGDALLFTGIKNPGPLSITFDTPVSRVGTQIQSDPINVSDYTATIEAFDSFNQSLGIFDLVGISKRKAGSGVIFVGISETSNAIKKLVLNAKEEGRNVPFAINTVSFQTIPEASNILGLLMFGTLGMTFQLKGRLKKNIPS
jgi:hypothetical protein